ncbi:NUDIX hydrolase [Zavarzinia compransoris]|uniref:NUDIX hydrolase n=1 Tax=Zavarzinia compransoris TaxID=1264899 RepID=A0A317E761_9PROT|nr:NUDIX hydrolase [Zavarzinia compransoris]PWR22076.1 NUDIX hydrolase [Zavarzinia compransoris]TDP47182.1 ADP-ribose pyrophosphatase YjhB (NUDIX family) [Zavarzinia compransoris]
MSTLYDLPADRGACHDFHHVVPDGDDRVRRVCRTCGFIDYVNPLIIVGTVISHDDRILLVRRAIEPRRGFWTIPAGYMEEGESVAEGAAREAWEEALARIEIDALLAVYSIPRISQVQLIHRAALPTPDFGIGPESLEARLFAFDEIPWDDLAFPSVHWALRHWHEVRGRSGFAPFANPPGF